LNDNVQGKNPMTKVALITGAGTGIGRSAVLALAEAGYAITLVGRRKELLETVAGEAQALGARTLVATADVGNPADMRAAFDATVTSFGRLDVVFNNAGVGAPAIPLEDLTFEQWKTVVDANLTGVFLGTQEAFRIMKAQTPMGGRIINNGSISASAPRPNSAPYTSTKHGVTGLTKSASLDGRKYNIAVSQIDIGNAATDMAMKMASGVPQADGSIRVEPLMDVKQVGSMIRHIAGMPLEANVQFVTIMATQMPFIGRG
jgi:NAD(P)-dependent dehydrogenase (short-subunit alcohol dehydrogenase family)